MENKKGGEKSPLNSKRRKQSMDLKERNPKPKSETVKEGKIDRTYFCPHQIGQSFYIPARDAEGNLIKDTDRLGQQRVINGVPLFRDVLCQFETISRGTKKNPDDTLCIYQLKADDRQYQDKFEALERLRKDASTWVMNEAEYNKWKNPEAADFKARVAELEKANAEKDSVIAEMQKQLEELTKPKG